MEVDTDRRSACDRCRGQKLRCVGPANPVFDLHSRYLRNQTPCDRCRKAQVECYTVPSTTRRGGTDTRQPRYQSKPSAGSRLSTENPPISLASEPATSHNPSNTRRVYSDFKSPEWSAIHPDDAGWSDNVDLDMPSAMPYTHVSTLDGLQHDTLPALNINISTDNHLDRVIEGFLSEGQGHNLSRSSSAVPDLATSSVPFGTGPDPDPISKCLQDLAELNGTLLHSRANRRGTGHSDLSQPQSIPTRAGSSVPPSIGHTLRHCQNFLTTIQHLQQRVNSDSGDDTWSPTRPEDGIGQLVTPLSPAAVYKPLRRFRSLDTPILFSILSCYSYILEEYERLFSSILQSVTQSVPQIPATLTGTSLDGFKLDGNNILQMELLLYVSSNLLGKIEAILLGSTEGTTTESNQGLLGCKMAGCLESLYDHNGLPSGDGAGKREVRARTLIRKVQAALKTIEK